MKRILPTAIFSLVIAIAVNASAQEAVITANAPTSNTTQTSSTVPDGINDQFKAAELNVDEWLERFEVESREVYGAREEVLKACEIKPGDRIADVGAGTDFYSRLFAKATGRSSPVVGLS